MSTKEIYVRFTLEFERTIRVPLAACIDGESLGELAQHKIQKVADEAEFSVDGESKNCTCRILAIRTTSPTP